jgi:hypothetical protein
VEHVHAFVAYRVFLGMYVCYPFAILVVAFCNAPAWIPRIVGRARRLSTHGTRESPTIHFSKYAEAWAYSTLLVTIVT